MINDNTNPLIYPYPAAEKALHVLLLEMESSAPPRVADMLAQAHDDAIMAEPCAAIPIAIERLTQGRFELMILASDDSEGEILQSIRLFRAMVVGIPIILITSLDSYRLAVCALQSGISDCLVKSELNPQTLVRAIHHAAARRSMDDTAFVNLLNAAHEGIWVMDGDTKLLFVNRKLANLLGYKTREMIKHSILEFVEDEAFKKEFSAEGARHCFWNERDIQFKRKDGQPLWAIVSMSPIAVSGAPLVGTMGMVTDITQRKMAEMELLRRDEYMACLTHISTELLRSPDSKATLGDAIERLRLVAKADGCCLCENGEQDGSVAFNLLFCAQGEKLSQGFILNASRQIEYAKAGLGRWLEVLSSGKPIWGLSTLLPEQEKRFLQTQGIEEVFVLPLRWENTWRGFLGFWNCDPRNIWSDQDAQLLSMAAAAVSGCFERQEYIRKIQTSEERVRLLFEGVQDGVLISRGERFTFFNKRLAEILGYTPDEMQDLPFEKAYLPEDLKKLRQHRASLEMGEEVSIRFQTQFRRKGGQLLPVEIHSRLISQDGEIASFEVIRDIAERKHLEAQLQQAMKMDAIGRLAGGIAHDFNNLLTSIIGNISLSRLAASSSISAKLAEAEKASYRAADLVKQLLAFSRKSEVSMQPVGVGRLLDEVAGIARSTFDRRLVIQVQLGENLAPAFGDFTQLYQVLLNLCINSRDALDERGLSSLHPPRITLCAQNVIVDDEYCAKYSYARSGPHIMLSVEDNGAGMEAETIRHIYEPFFTTKPAGKGTGRCLWNRQTAHGSSSGERSGKWRLLPNGLLQLPAQSQLPLPPRKSPLPAKCQGEARRSFWWTMSRPFAIGESNSSCISAIR